MDSILTNAQLLATAGIAGLVVLVVVLVLVSAVRRRRQYRAYRRERQHLAAIRGQLARERQRRPWR